MTAFDASSAKARAIRVLVVEDSATARALLVSILLADPAIAVVGEAADGAEAVRMAVELAPDVITMDIHMPVLDGLDATKAIMRDAPTPIVIVSAAAARDVELSLSATQAGAVMLVAKPSGPASPDFADQASRLVAMVKAMSQVKVVRRWRAGEPAPAPTVYPKRGRKATAPPRVVAIGTSTGGPAALHRILIDLPPDFPLPILVVQHIARGFVAGLASWLAANCALRLRVAAEGDSLEGGTVYLAPDGHHLGVGPAGRVRLSDVAAIGGFRPSIDHLFASCASAYGSAMIALILTGMGRDGVGGLGAVFRAGGAILAQDEPTSVVFGMNGEAVAEGLVDECLALEMIAPRLRELVT